MRISFSPNFHNVNLINNKSFNKLQNKQMCGDVFIKSTSFKGLDDDKSFAAFDNWASKNNFLANSFDIIFDEENYLGVDSDGPVYSIPNCKNWVLKKHKPNRNFVQTQVKNPIYFEVEDVSPSLNIGQAIGVLKIPTTPRITESFYIHKAQTGGPLGVRDSSLKSVSMSTSKTHIESLSKIGKLPQSSFDKVVREAMNIAQMGYSINGAFPNNFLLDTDTNTLSIKTNSKDNPNNKSQCSEVLFGLLGGSFVENFEKSHRPQNEKDKAEQLSNIICAKFFQAMKNEKAKFAVTPNLKSLVESTPFTNVIETNDSIKKVNELVNAGLI